MKEPERRSGFRFSGGHPALDLTATLAGRLKASPRERLATPDDLARWLMAAGLAAALPTVTAAELATARELREAIYALAMNRIAGGLPLPEAVARLNRLAAGSAAVPQLGAAGDLRLVGPAGALLVTLARQAVRLFGGAEAERLRQCQAATCALLFLDLSRGGDRRWCSMSGCGNKAKVAALRHRRRRAGAGSDGATTPSGSDLSPLSARSTPEER